jgi:hypothetical protein
MTDRELLEVAAKAAGLTIGELGGRVVRYESDGQPVYWNPLTDDGDALRLAVKLRMCVETWGSGAAAVVTVNNRALVAEPHYGDDPERATRRAIVRAAAATSTKEPA